MYSKETHFWPLLNNPFIGRFILEYYKNITMNNNIAVQSQESVAAYFSSKQSLLSNLA